MPMDRFEQIRLRHHVQSERIGERHRLAQREILENSARKNKDRTAKDRMEPSRGLASDRPRRILRPADEQQHYEPPEQAAAPRRDEDPRRSWLV